MNKNLRIISVDNAKKKAKNSPITCLIGMEDINANRKIAKCDQVLVS